MAETMIKKTSTAVSGNQAQQQKEQVHAALILQYIHGDIPNPGALNNLIIKRSQIAVLSSIQQSQDPVTAPISEEIVPIADQQMRVAASDLAALNTQLSTTEMKSFIRLALTPSTLTNNLEHRIATVKASTGDDEPLKSVLLYLEENQWDTAKAIQQYQSDLSIRTVPGEEDNDDGTTKPSAAKKKAKKTSRKLIEWSDRERLYLRNRYACPPIDAPNHSAIVTDYNKAFNGLYLPGKSHFYDGRTAASIQGFVSREFIIPNAPYKTASSAVSNEAAKEKLNGLREAEEAEFWVRFGSDESEAREKATAGKSRL